MKYQFLKFSFVALLLMASWPSRAEETSPPPAESPPAEAPPPESPPDGTPPKNDLTSQTSNPETPTPEATTSKNPSPKSPNSPATQTDSESTPPAEIKTAAPPQNDAVTAQRKNGLARLKAKLTNKEGNPVTLGVLIPMDYTTLNYAQLSEDTVVDSIQHFDKVEVRRIPDQVSNLTLQEFRRVVVKHKLDLVVVVVLKPTNFDFFLFDRRTPYDIFVHSETLPEELQYHLAPATVQEYSKIIVRRVFYSYMQDQHFELPREETPRVLNAELPRWIASTQSLVTVNREILSNFYGSASLGGALMAGNDKSWTSNIVGLQLGWKMGGPYYLEAAADLFAYNAFVLSAKYMVSSIDSPTRLLIGVGGGYTMNAHTLNWDQNETQGLGSVYFVPSFSVIAPIVDVHIKVESQVFIGAGKMVFTLLPGLFLMF